MHCIFWFCLYFMLVARATNTTNDNPSTLPITFISNYHPTFHSPSTIQFELGIHPWLIDSVNYAFLAKQGYICRVSHSFKHISPWVSLLLILSGNVSINPGPNTSLFTLRNILVKHSPIERKEAPLHPEKDLLNTDILSAKHLKWKYMSEYGASQDTDTILQSLLKTMTI